MDYSKSRSFTLAAGLVLASAAAALGFSGSPLSAQSVGYDGRLADDTCGANEAMVGLHVDRNKLRCIRIVGEQVRGWDRNGLTQRQDMHACPIGQYAIDYNNAQNDLLCGYGALLDVRSEQLRECSEGSNQVAGGSGWTMCGCPSRDGRTYVVTGVRNDRNQVLCTAIRRSR